MSDTFNTNSETSSQQPFSGEFMFGMRDLNAPNHMKLIKLEDLCIPEGKRKIIIFPGGKAMTPEKGNGMCKLTEQEFFPSLFSSYDITSAPTEEIIKIRKALYQAKILREKYDIYAMVYNSRNYALQAQEFFDNVIIPAIARKDAHGNLQRIDAQEAEANMRNFIFSAHCYGVYITKAIDEELKKVLPQLGYSDEECQQIARQCIVFTHNSIDECLGNEKPMMTHIHRIPLTDYALQYEDCRPGTYQRFIKSGAYNSEDPCFAILYENEAVLLTPTLCKNSEEDHNGYWSDDKNLTAVGLQERQLFEIVSQEILSSDKLADDMNKFLSKISQKNHKNRPFIKKMRDVGITHMKKFISYRDKVAIVQGIMAAGRIFR